MRAHLLPGRVPAWLLLLAFTLVPSTLSAASTAGRSSPTPRASIQSVAPCYGPRTFVRTPGSSQTFVEAFGVASPGAAHVLRVKNGDRYRQQRLSGVRIAIGGELQFCGADIGLDDPLSERVIYPGERESEITIELTGAEAGEITIDIRPHVGTAPFADAGADRAVQVGEVVQLNASASRSATGSAPQIAWELVSAPASSTAAVAPSSAPLASFVADVAGAYVARVVVSAGGMSATATVTIHALGGGNLPPIASAGPNVGLEVGGSVQLDGSGSFDPEGQPLDYTWTLGSGPPGHNGQLLNTTSVTPTFTADLPGFYVVSLTVNDGTLDSELPDRTRITVSAFNAAPVADAGLDQNVPSGATVQLDGSGSFDPEGQPLGYSWSLSFIPPGSNAALSDPFAESPTFVADLAGAYTARLIVSDGLKFSQPDEVLVTATSSQVSVPNVVGLTQSAAQDAVQAAGLAVGVLASVQSASVASGSVAGQTPLAGALVAPATPVDLDISIGGGVDIVPPTVSVNAAPSIVNAGEAVQITVIATDDVGVVSVTLELNGVAVALDAANQATFTPTVSGLYEARATAIDAAGLAGSAAKTFVARAATNNGPPSVALTSPVEDATISAAVGVIGTASDADLAYYELQLAPAASGQFVTFVTGTSSVVGGQLGRLTPGSFAPGVYDLRVCAQDTWGNNACSASVRIELDAVKRAPGLVSFAFLDGFVDVVGLPISVRRVYDGANKTVGDFGVGWRLDTDSVKLETTRQMGADWQIQKVGTIFATYFLNPSKDHRVNVFLPDGTAHRFRMRPDPSSQQLIPIDFLNAAFFDALPGTTSTLTPNDQPCFVQPVLNSSGPVQLFDCNVELYNPTGYTLNLADGRRLTFVEDGSPLRFRLATLRDTNDNVVTFGANGISHSAGAGVSWTRDGLGRITSLTNPAGDSRTYSYDARGDLVEVTDFAGNITSFVYDDAHNLVRVIDPRGFTPGTLIYNGSGQIVAMIDPDGNRVDISYDTVNNQQIITDRLGNTTIFSFDAAGNLTSTVDPLGHQSTFTYDADGRVLTQINPLGHTNSFTYDSEGRLLTHTDPLGRTSAKTYDAGGHVVTQTDPLGNVTNFAYDAAGNPQQVNTPGGASFDLQYASNGSLTQVNDSGGATRTFGTNAQGRLSSFTDADGSTTNVLMRDDGQVAGSSFDLNGQSVNYAYSYDINGQLESATLPSGATATLERDAGGFPSRIVDTRGGVQQMVFDSEGELISHSGVDGGTQSVTLDAERRAVRIDLPGGAMVERTLDPLGRPIDVRMADGTHVQTQYDAAGRPVMQQRVGQGAVTFGHDAAGQLTHLTTADGAVSTTQYDAAGRPVARTNALGATTSMQYDADGNLTEVTLPTGAVLRSTFDDFGNTLSIEDPVGARVEYSYDSSGQLTTTRDASLNSTHFVYDAAGSRVSAVMPGGATWGWTYDGLGRQRSRSLPWGASHLYEVDEYGLVTKITDPTGVATTYSYDTAGRLIDSGPIGGPRELRQYDAAGRLTQVTEAGQLTTLTHDVNGRLQRVERPDGSFVEYEYDIAGRVSRLRTAGGATQYSYDLVGRLSGASDSVLGITSYSYDLAGRVSSILLPDGSLTQIGRDARGAVTSVVTTNAGATIRSATYSYDVAGKLLNVDEVSRSATYTYDSAGRLASETRLGLDAGSAAYAFDLNGSLVQNGARSLTYDAVLRLTNDGVYSNYTYDAAGRPTSRSSLSSSEQFYYDARGSLIRVERAGAAPNVVNLEYDHFGLLRRIESDGVARVLLWDSLGAMPRLLEERTDGGQLLRRYVYALGPVGFVDTTRHVVHSDPNSGVRVVTAVSSGAVEAQYAYSAFGESTMGASNSLSSLRHNGELFVPELGLYYLRTRFYDPIAGRFLTPDQLDPVGTSAITFHPYQYADGNPVSLKDPSGARTLSGLSIGISIAGILAGFAISYFPSPLALVISGIAGPPPAFTYPVGGEIGLKASGALSAGGVFAATGGVKLKAITDWNSNWLFSAGIEVGLSLSIAPPAQLLSRTPVSFSASVGIPFGEVFGPPKSPSFSNSLQISGNLAVQVADGYLRSVRALPGGFTLVELRRKFQKTSAAISIKLFSPYEDHVREVWTGSISANESTSTSGVIGQLLRGVPGSAVGGPRALGSTVFTAGLAFNASMPLVWLHWTADGRLDRGDAFEPHLDSLVSLFGGL